ncbi:peptidylprolyl isomerase [Clostridium sediminicola]|uniref:peptidylprolyl isomerase n=1 Tax=Clostridium sediminicola TaxID=3114879 RepID=UPI0031F26C2A
MENKVLALVNGQEITSTELEAALSRIPQDRKAYFSNEQGKAQLLEQLIAFELFYNDAKDSGLEENEVYKERLELFKRELLAQVAMENAMKSVEVKEEEIKKFYDENTENFVVPENVSAKHILVDNEEKANEILGEINDGLAFEEAAEKYSSCPSKAQGGSLGSFSKGQMVKEFEEAAFASEIGTITGPVQTQFGYHLIKVEGKSEKSNRNFDEVKNEIRMNLLQSKQGEAYVNHVNELKGKYSVEIK